MSPKEGSISYLSGLNSITDQAERLRISKFINILADQCKSKPAYVIRSPGRINLIGDHIDYHGFPVLPMAIDNSILLGLSITDRTDESLAHIRIINKDQSTYKSFVDKQSFTYGSQLDQSHEWHHYVLCGYHGVLATNLLNIEPSEVSSNAKTIPKYDYELDRVLVEKFVNDLDIFIDSDLPPASGLSSSSALVCASAVATKLYLSSFESHFKHDGDQQPEIDSKLMAANCAKFEHLIGTHGGGMDQAVIMTAQEGFAKHVEFMPDFKCTNVRLPEDVIWLVSHCGSSHSKAATSCFNMRVLETKLGAALIVKILNKSNDQLALNHSICLKQVKDLVFESKSTEDICRTLRDEVFVDKDYLGIDEICKILDMSRSELVENFKTSEDFIMKNNLNTRVCLLKRCEHVFEEAERVSKFRMICETTKDIRKLGQLMSESHMSLRDKYECSHEDLDKLVDISLSSGALGARLTGAGWGGCIVTMVEASKCQQVRGELEKVSKFTFQTEPRSGCTIIKT